VGTRATGVVLTALSALTVVGVVLLLSVNPHDEPGDPDLPFILGLLVLSLTSLAVSTALLLPRRPDRS
jgi:hypothetical protein